MAIATPPVRLAVATLCAVFLLSGSPSAQETLPADLQELSPPVPVPEQVPVETGHVDVPGARLWYWDTGGDGPAIVLLHPATGSGLVWEYQQPVFAKARYRVIGYSRKNYVRSEITSPEEIGADVDDLHGLVETLELGRFHAVGLAAGGGIVMEYSVIHPDRLLSMTIACSLGRINDAAYQRASAALRPASFYRLPAEVRELGPCYRAANPAGTKYWISLKDKARPNRPFLSGRRTGAEVTWEKMRANAIPTLLIGGDADLYTPPPMLKYFHDRMPHSQMKIIQGCGHSAYWEQPESFNRTVLKFLSSRKFE